MRVDNSAFAEANLNDFREPRMVFEIEFADGDLHYFTSHADVSIPGEPNVYSDVVSSASVTSQRLNPDKANSEIGAINFKLLDIGLTELQRSKLQGEDKGLRGRRVRFYVGSINLDWTDYILANTQLIEEVKYSKGAYTFQCADLQRQLREDIFEPKEIGISQSFSYDDTELVVYSTEGFELVQQPDVSGSAAPGQKVGFIKVNGQNDDFEILSYSSKDGSTFYGLERGLFNTQPITLSRAADETADNAPTVTEFIYMEMPAAMMAYAVLTGAVYGYPGEYLPDHWNLGIKPEYIATSDFTGIGSDLWNPADPNEGLVARLENLDEEDGKQFLEENLFRLMGCFPIIYSDGQLGIRRMTGVHSNGGNVRLLDESNVVKADSLTHDMKSLVNRIIVRWNYSIYKDAFTRSNLMVDPASIERHGEAKLKEIEFRALNGSRHSYSTIRKVLDSLRDRYAGPPIKIKVVLLPQNNDLEVGDIVRLDIKNLKDYTGEAVDGHLQRNFEIQRISTDWRTGNVTADLFGSSQPASALPPEEPGTALPDEQYQRGQEISPANFPGKVTSAEGITTITADLDLSGGTSLADDASYYWCADDLRVDDDVTVTISDNVALLVRGFLDLGNGMIDGIGRGFPGALGCSGIRSGSGGWAGKISDWGAANFGTPGFLNINSTPQGGSFERHFPPEGKSYIESLDRGTLGSARVGGQLEPGAPIPRIDPIVDGSLSVEFDLRGGSGSGGGAHAYGWVEENYAGPGGAGGDGGAGLMIVCRGMDIGVNGKINLSGTQGSLGVGRSRFDNGSYTYAGSGGPGGPGACYIFIDGHTNNPPSLDGFNSIADGGDLIWRGTRLGAGTRTDRSHKYVTRSIAHGPAPQEGTLRTSPAPGTVAWENAFFVRILTGETVAVPDIPPVTQNPAPPTVVERPNTPRSANANLSTVEVAVERPDDISYKYAVVEYREKGDTGWFEVGPASPEVGFVVPSDGKTYEVRARGVSLAGNVVPDAPIQEITTTKILNADPGDEDVDDVVEVPNVHGLELFEQGNDAVFGGRDAKFVWRKTSVTEWLEMGSEGQLGASRGSLDLYFKDYQVEVWADGSLVRTEWVVDPAFVYTYEKNAEDYAREQGQAGAWRAFECRVYCRGRQNQLSAQAAKLPVENVAPELPDAITVSASFRSLQIDYDAPADLDYKDTRVWLSQSTGFIPGPANQVAQAYGGPVVIAGLADGTEYFLRFATYDAFGQGTMSTEFSVTTASLSSGDVDGLGPWATVTDADKAFIDENLDDDAIEGTKIVKLTASKIVTGTLAATEKISVAGQVESVVGDAVATLGPKSADGKTGMITYQYNGSTLFAVYSDGSAAFSGAVTITGGSGYANLSDKPASLDDISSTEYSTLTQASADASQAISDAADAQAAADGKVTSFYQSSAPTADGVGDLWVDSDTDRLYRWSGSSWVEIQDKGIADALSDAATAQDTADSKVVTFYQTGTPTAGTVGDLWVDTDDGNRLYRWDGSAWQDVHDSAIDTALSNAATAQAAADGKIQSFYQNGQPSSGMSEGDLWFDTDDGNHAYRYNGSAWVDAQDSGISTALSDAADAQATADGKVTTFFGTSTPTAEGIGDLWYNDTTKVMKRWDGSAWVDTATAGADWSSNLDNIPARLGDTPSTGLNLTASHLGYYDGSNWTAYIDDDGGFYFGDGAQSYISFGNDELTLGPEVSFFGTSAINNPGMFINLDVLSEKSGEAHFDFTSFGTPQYLFNSVTGYTHIVDSADGVGGTCTSVGTCWSRYSSHEVNPTFDRDFTFRIAVKNMNINWDSSSDGTGASFITLFDRAPASNASYRVQLRLDRTGMYGRVGSNSVGGANQYTPVDFGITPDNSISYNIFTTGVYDIRWSASEKKLRFYKDYVFVGEIEDTDDELVGDFSNSNSAFSVVAYAFQDNNGQDTQSTFSYSQIIFAQQ